MAAPWIKWSKGLTLKREVLLLAAELHRDVHEIAGRLMRFWEWLDDNVTSDQVDENGNARVTLGALPLALVDSISGVTGFGEALTRVHWLTVDGGDLVVVNFGRHNGETAKTRSLTAVRVAKHKTKKASGNASGNGTGNAAVTVDALPRKEEIREEYLSNKKEPAGGDRITDGASLPDSTITVRHEVDPMEVQRRADEALEQSLDLVDDWPLPTAIDDSEGRHWVASWVASRFLAGHGWMNHLQWDGHTSGHRSMSREWWQRALQASAAGGWKNLAKHVGKPVDECKPKQRKPRLLTPEEIEVYNATGQLPDGALDPL